MSARLLGGVWLEGDVRAAVGWEAGVVEVVLSLATGRRSVSVRPDPTACRSLARLLNQAAALAEQPRCAEPAVNGVTTAAGGVLAPMGRSLHREAYTAIQPEVAR